MCYQSSAVGWAVGDCALLEDLAWQDFCTISSAFWCFPLAFLQPEGVTV